MTEIVIVQETVRRFSYEWKLTGFAILSNGWLSIPEQLHFVVSCACLMIFWTVFVSMVFFILGVCCTVVDIRCHWQWLKGTLPMQGDVVLKVECFNKNSGQ